MTSLPQTTPTEPPPEGTVEAIPTFGFDGFHAESLSFAHVERVPPADGEKKPNGIQDNVAISGNVSINAESDRALLTLVVEVVSDPKWRPYRIRVVMVGRFRKATGTRDQFLEFCQKGAPSILFPYVREAVYRLSLDGRFGVVRLNPLNLQALLSWESKESPETSGPSEPEQPSGQ